MGQINIEELNRFVFKPVQVTILDEQGVDRAPFINKMIKKFDFCPDRTHVRIYFDDFYFLAVPLSSQVEETDKKWSAFDQEAGLYYIMQA